MESELAGVSDASSKKLMISPFDKPVVHFRCSGHSQRVSDERTEIGYGTFEKTGTETGIRRRMIVATGLLER